MKIQGTINHLGVEIVINENNITEFVVEDGKMAITVLIEGKELTFRENSIYSIKIAYIIDKLQQDVQNTEQLIRSVKS